MCRPAWSTSSVKAPLLWCGPYSAGPRDIRAGPRSLLVGVKYTSVLRRNGRLRGHIVSVWQPDPSRWGSSFTDAGSIRRRSPPTQLLRHQLPRPAHEATRRAHCCVRNAAGTTSTVGVRPDPTSGPPSPGICRPIEGSLVDGSTCRSTSVRRFGIGVNTTKRSASLDRANTEQDS